MTKLEFMKELESLLSDIPLEEREEALRYYSGYFEDAGEEHEGEIIMELGSPMRVASIIKADLNMNETDRNSRGYFTENGYQDTIINNEKFEIVDPGKKKANSQQTENTNSTNNANGQTTQNSKNNSDSNIALIVLIAIFTFPFWISIFGIIIGILGAIFGIVVGFGAAGIAMIVTGIALFVVGIVQLSVPLMGLLFCGGGLLVLGLGMLFMSLCILLCKNVLPAMIRGIVNLCKLPFKNRSVMA